METVRINEAILNAQQGDLTSVLQNSGFSYSQARDAVDYWVEMFDLTTEEELQLLEVIRDVFSESKDWTFEQQRDLLVAIDRLSESIEGGGTTGTQAFRSVTTITESQANIMIGLQNSLIQVNRQGFESIARGLGELNSSIITGAGIRVSGNTFIIQGGGSDGESLEGALRNSLSNIIRAAGSERM